MSTEITAFEEYEKRRDAMKILYSSSNINATYKRLDAYIKCTPGNYYFSTGLSNIIKYLKGGDLPVFNSENIGTDKSIPMISLFGDEYNIWEMIKYIFHYNYPEATEKYFWEYLALDYNEIVKHYRPMEEIEDWSNQRGY